ERRAAPVLAVLDARADPLGERDRAGAGYGRRDHPRAPLAVGGDEVLAADRAADRLREATVRDAAVLRLRLGRRGGGDPLAVDQLDAQQRQPAALALRAVDVPLERRDPQVAVVHRG